MIYNFVIEHLDHFCWDNVRKTRLNSARQSRGGTTTLQSARVPRRRRRHRGLVRWAARRGQVGSVGPCNALGTAPATSPTLSGEQLVGFWPAAPPPWSRDHIAKPKLCPGCFVQIKGMVVRLPIFPGFSLQKHFLPL
jgi:hypothetical protein